MTAFLIVAVVVLAVNAVFLLASLLYTIRASKSKGDPRLSLQPSLFTGELGNRMSLQPQMVMFEAIVRYSRGSLPELPRYQESQKETERQEG